ncbi:hypothetical protein [Lactobacillus crispatus]|jgi:hypothetical protein|uniref:Uncharacterized protein n=1 Tax=Lactobacillus crispatus TaxID=47770 RepID=A0ABV2BDI9_9LACO|nr:hypothetical protein [Lactobacillus crispatus]MCZ3600840.1 hypothetical protein [Lactobacillus crispatus]
MSLLIIICIATGFFFYYKKRKNEIEEQKNEQRSRFGHHSQSKASYTTIIPTDIRSKNAIDAYLSSNRSSIKPLNQSNIDYSEQEQDKEANLQKEEIASDDLLVNSNTGEIVTPDMAFNNEEDLNSDTVEGSATILPADSDATVAKDHRISSPNRAISSSEGNSDSTLSQKSKVNTKDWKQKNNQAINDLIN